MQGIIMQNNKYQGQISSYHSSNKYQMIKNESLIPLEPDEYIERIGIFAPPGSQFNITQYGINGTTTIQIGKTFMYEAFNTQITDVQYIGTSAIDDELAYSLPATDTKRIYIDYIVKKVSS